MRVLVLLLLLGLSIVAQADDFATANVAYAEGKFEDARRGYERVLKERGYANVYFNQGNAFYRLKDSGRATLAYERALLARPAHPEAAANLKFVRAKTGAHVPEEEWKEKAWRYVAQPAALGGAIAVAWVGLLIVGISILRRKSRWARATGVFLFLIGAAGVGTLHFGQRELTRLAIVIVERTDARTEPADRAGLAESLPAGSRVRIISNQGDWTYCELPNGSRGWLSTKSVETLLPPRAA